MTNDWMDDLLKEELHKEIRVPSDLDRKIRTRLGDGKEKKSHQRLYTRPPSL